MRNLLVVQNLSISISNTFQRWNAAFFTSIVEKMQSAKLIEKNKKSVLEKNFCEFEIFKQRLKI